MSDPKRNAAIWYASDAFDPKSKGINGRRVAGESFLRGFFKHVDADELHAVVQGVNAGKQFQDLAAPYANGRPVRAFQSYLDAGTDGPSTVNYPAPNLKAEAWRRYHFGQSAFSICGITHTTATGTIMNAMFDLRTAPIEEWDGIICTSNAVLSQVNYQFDLFDDYAGKRFGCAKPVRPQTKLIPLGIHTDEFVTTQDQRKSLRSELEIDDDDVVFLTLSRLSANEKFDPLPVYRALAVAQRHTGKRIHYILCGYFPTKSAEQIFRNSAKALMPNVTLHVVDGKEEQKRKRAFAAADAFLFLIDNIQETFGVAPIEAMAAGLPIIASDWDGLRDTVTDDVGFRIPTEMPASPLLSGESLRHQLQVDTYPHYAALVASVTVIDVDRTAAAMVKLINDPDLRRKMGDAAVKRATSIYDWQHVIPQMQDFWGELTDIRLQNQQAENDRYVGTEIPFSPDVSKLFSSYPTQQRNLLDIAFLPIKGSTEQAIKYLYQHRDFKSLGREVESIRHVTLFQKTLHHGNGPLTPRQISQQTGLSLNRTERICFFLLKYAFIKEVTVTH